MVSVLFKIGDSVSVRRGNGAIDSGWEVTEFIFEWVVVRKLAKSYRSGEYLIQEFKYKRIFTKELADLNNIIFDHPTS